jgi:hypothetical protein
LDTQVKSYKVVSGSTIALGMRDAAHLPASAIHSAGIAVNPIDASRNSRARRARGPSSLAHMFRVTGSYRVIDEIYVVAGEGYG